MTSSQKQGVHVVYNDALKPRLEGLGVLVCSVVSKQACKIKFTFTSKCAQLSHLTVVGVRSLASRSSLIEQAEEERLNRRGYPLRGRHHPFNWQVCFLTSGQVMFLR